RLLSSRPAAPRTSRVGTVRLTARGFRTLPIPVAEGSFGLYSDSAAEASETDIPRHPTIDPHERPERDTNLSPSGCFCFLPDPRPRDWWNRLIPHNPSSLSASDYKRVIFPTAVQVRRNAGRCQSRDSAPPLGDGWRDAV